MTSFLIKDCIFFIFYFNFADALLCPDANAFKLINQITLMIKTIEEKVQTAAIGSEAYLHPLCTLTEIKTEGVLCSSLKQLEDDEKFYFEW